MPRASAEGACRACDSPSSSSPLALTDEEAAFIKRYAGRSPYAGAVERLEREVETLAETVRRLRGVTPSDTGLLPSDAWDLAADVASTRDPDTAALHVGLVTKVLDPSPTPPTKPATSSTSSTTRSTSPASPPTSLPLTLTRAHA